MRGLVPVSLSLSLLLLLHTTTIKGFLPLFAFSPLFTHPNRFEEFNALDTGTLVKNEKYHRMKGSRHWGQHLVVSIGGVKKSLCSACNAVKNREEFDGLGNKTGLILEVR